MYNNLPALTNNILWDNQLLATSYNTLNEESLRIALQEYISSVNNLHDEWYPPDSSPLSLWVARHDQLSLYRPGLLCAERIVLCDTLEESSLRLSSLGMAVATDIFVQNRDTDRLQNIREDIAHFVRFTKENFFLIQAGFIAITPCKSSRQEHQRRTQLLEDNSDRNFLKSIMPSSVARLYERNLKIRGIERVSHDGHCRFVEEKSLPGEIMLELRNCLSPYVNGHIFQNIKPISKNDDGTLTVEITRGKPTSRRSYERWVQGATNRSIYFHYKNLLTDLGQAVRSGASLVTHCPMQGKILEKIDETGRLSRKMLEIDVPFLNGLSLEDIYRLRTDFEPSFTAFRRSLRDCALEMELAATPEQICQLQNRFKERIADEGLADLRTKLSAWKRQSIQDTALLAVPAVLGYTGGSMITTLATGAATLLQAALGAQRNWKEVSRHPSYFLLRTLNKK